MRRRAALPGRLETLPERTALVWSDGQTDQRAEEVRPYVLGRAGTDELPHAIDARFEVSSWSSLDVTTDRISGVVKGSVLQRWVNPTTARVSIGVDENGWSLPPSEPATFEFVVVLEDDGWRLDELHTKVPV